MKTVNIYYIFDASVKIRGNAQHRIEENITRISRVLGFSPYKTKLHIIGYRDRAFFGKPHERIGAFGNPDFAEGLRMLGNVLDYGRKYEHSKARSVFIWHTSYSTEHQISTQKRLSIVSPKHRREYYITSRRAGFAL